MVGAGCTLTLTGLCYKMANDRNGKYVPREICDVIHRESQVKVEATRNILENKIVELKDDLVEIKADVKTLLQGKHG